jgi:hypothetical protein
LPANKWWGKWFSCPPPEAPPSLSFFFPLLIFLSSLLFPLFSRYYSPQFSATASVSVRRLAWALGVSMPKAMDIIVDELSAVFSPSFVCPKCKDKTKCELCGFNQPPAAETAAAAI